MFDMDVGQIRYCMDEKKRHAIALEPGKKPGLMYILLMIVAAACVIYGIFGLVTGKW